MGQRRKRSISAASAKGHPSEGPKTLGQVIRLVHQICCIAGSPSLIDDIRSEGNPRTLGQLIVSEDSAGLFNWLIVTLSYQGISDHAASVYIERHGSVSWNRIKRELARSPSCPKLGSYWQFDGCRYVKSKGCCARPDHYAACPLPLHPLRNGRINQTAYSLYLFIRDVAGGNLVGWIDEQILCSSKSRLNQETLIGPLRNVYGLADKVLSLALASVLLAAPDDRRHWHQLGGGMIAVDTLVHKFFHRTGVLRSMNAQHPYGPACYSPKGCAQIIERVSQRIDARQFNRRFPRVFPRFVQYALWRFCAQDALNICNSVRVNDRERCGHGWCQLYRRCARFYVGRFK